MDLKTFVINIYIGECSYNNNDTGCLFSPNNLHYHSDVLKVLEEIIHKIEICKQIQSTVESQSPDRFSTIIDSTDLAKIISRYESYLIYWQQIKDKDPAVWEKIKEIIYDKYECQSFEHDLFSSIRLENSTEVKITNDLYIYFEKWKNQTVKLEEWEKYSFLNIFHFLNSYYPIETIWTQQKSLISEFATKEISVLNESISNSNNPNELKEFRISLLSELFNSKEVNEKNRFELKRLLKLKDLDISEILEQYPVYLENGAILTNKQLFAKNLSELKSESIISVQILFEHYQYLKNKDHSKKIITSDLIDKSFDTFFSETEQIYLLKMLESLKITNAEGKSILGDRKKSAIRGVVEGLHEFDKFKSLNLGELYRLIAKKIDLNLPKNLDSSNTSSDIKESTLNYLKKFPMI